MNLHFTEEEMEDFLKAHGFQIVNVPGWQHHTGTEFIDIERKMAFHYWKRNKFIKKIEEANGNISPLFETYGLSNVFQKEFKKALLKL